VISSSKESQKCVSPSYKMFEGQHSVGSIICGMDMKT
jgi:hypothetical protein